MDTLHTLAQVREKRHKDAQMGVLVAHTHVEEAKKKLDLAEKELEAYQKELPELIRLLYIDILGQKVDVPVVQEKMQLELKLVQKKQDFIQAVVKAKTALEGAQQALAVAQNELAKQERKKMAMQELLNEEAKQEKVHQEKSLAKVIDELANVRYVTKQSRS